MHDVNDNVKELRKRYVDGMVKTADGNAIPLEELNFGKCIIGSDKAGKDFKPGSGKKTGNLHELLRHEHKVALLTLAGDVPYDYMVVDEIKLTY